MVQGILAIHKSVLTAPTAQRSLNQFGTILHANGNPVMKKMIFCEVYESNKNGIVFPAHRALLHIWNV